MNTNAMRILIIEDEESIRESFQWFLEDLGHKVFVFESPEDCVTREDGFYRLRIPAIDAMILDHHLPHLFGLDLLEGLCRNTEQSYPDNIILMSGDTTSFSRERALSTGATVLQKPVTFGYLRQWLEQIEKRQ